MKTSNLVILLFCINTLLLLTESCNTEDNCPAINCNAGTLNEVTCECDCPSGFSGTNCEIEDLCISQNVDCQNGGTCIDGICDCPEFYVGTNCENFDPTKVQILLDAGQTPKTLFDGGVPLDSLYGKLYAGGIIFYLNTANGIGMVAALEDQSTGAEWGCHGTDIMSLNNVSGVDPDTEIGARLGDGKANTDAILLECMPNDGIAAKLCRDLGEDWFLPSRSELYLLYTNLYLKGLGGLTSDYYWSSTEQHAGNGWFYYFIVGNRGTLNKDQNLHVRAVRAF